MINPPIHPIASQCSASGVPCPQDFQRGKATVVWRKGPGIICHLHLDFLSGLIVRLEKAQRRHGGQSSPCWCRCCCTPECSNFNWNRYGTWTLGCECTLCRWSAQGACAIIVLSAFCSCLVLADACIGAWWDERGRNIHRHRNKCWWSVISCNFFMAQLVTCMHNIHSCIHTYIFILFYLFICV